MNLRISFCVAAAILAFGVVSCEQTDVSSTAATITALNCSSATFSGSATSGTAFSGTASVPYAGGNGGAFAAVTGVASTGVTGLTATLAAGTLASGAGTLTWAISGTPTGSGTANFAVSVGGQSCSFSLPVAAGSSGTTSPATGWGVASDVASVVKLAETFKAALSSSQVASLQYAYTLAHAKKWSNLPEELYRGRVGLASGTFSKDQWTAFNNLLKAATSSVKGEGSEEYAGIIAADDYLNSIGGGSGYGSGNYYVAFIGTPSTTGLWILQIGGHHGTVIHTYNGGKLTGGTPSFRSTEPFPTYTWNGVNYNPIQQEQTALAAMLKGLSSAELTSAKRASAQNDLILGPGQDGKFPASRTGVRAGDLSAAKKELILAAIKTYTDDLDAQAGAAIFEKYKADIENTYISYYGTTDLTAKGDYVLIDGPNVWIEFSMQGGIIVRNANHPHSVWRDRAADYGGN